MMTEASPTQDKSLLFSFILHLVIFLFLLLNKSFFSIGLLDPESTEIMVIEPSVRVDIVQMPSQTLQELKKLDLTVDVPKGEELVIDEKSKPAQSVNEAEQIEFQTEKKEKSFSDVLKELSAKKLEKSAPEKKQAKKGQKTGSEKITNSQQAELQKLLLAGNKLSDGTASQGSGTAQLQGFNAYISKLPDHVRPHWKLPSYLMGQGLKCRIRIFLNLQGNVVQSKIWESSGNEEYDNRALKAIEQSQPFPLFDKEFLSRAIAGDIVLGFPL